MAQVEQDRRIAGGLLSGAAVFAVLTVAADSMLAAYTAGGFLLGALLVYRRTVSRRPYSNWPAWFVGGAGALLMSWPAGEAARLVLLPLAAIYVLMGGVLFALWRRRRWGRGDWIVWLPDEGVVLRREWSRRDAIYWAENERHGVQHPAISLVDEFPDVADAVPLYPHRDRPGIAVPRPTS